jgi:hypothetical protein
MPDNLHKYIPWERRQNRHITAVFVTDKENKKKAIQTGKETYPGLPC